MLADTFVLLKAKREEIESQRALIDVTHDYWVTRAELEGAVGGRLDADHHEHGGA
jgi:outer membrane protein TolC